MKEYGWKTLALAFVASVVAFVHYLHEVQLLPAADYAWLAAHQKSLTELFVASVLTVYRLNQARQQKSIRSIEDAIRVIQSALDTSAQTNTDQRNGS
jgi:hypothetical protein